jgi:hypothetical protein
MKFEVPNWHLKIHRIIIVSRGVSDPAPRVITDLFRRAGVALYRRAGSLTLP